eukprot:TRINITY_DN5315_c0_g1_i2.p1 TRINITY_DN5315_c0_g1~~TRINITY_DN5315_c0_g1_i2.p1  ORF type:complete len:485 (-),score=169.56 TRINITY_DN5315_c0_g1_i2:14-1468(-)
MAFSNALTLSDLNDFINPSQACVKPVAIEKTGPKDGKKAKLTVTLDGDYFQEEEDGTTSVLESAKITLNDCLACSGCVTSAETVLITAQSTKEFLSNCKVNEKNESNELNRKTIVVSISPQSRASLAVHFGLSSISTHKKLTTLLKKELGVDYVFDTSFSREFSLRESAAEFIARYRKNYGEKGKELPMLASACPGWICLAEKNHGEYILPYISSTKSPQQIMGTIVKEYFAGKLNLPSNQIYHATVMPCYDKKLEASRDDFYNDILSTRDVDCVLSSGEILDIIHEKGIDFKSLEESPLDQLFTNVDKEERLFGMSGGSGGYLEYIFKTAAKELFGITVEEIKWQPSRNNDFKSTFLEVEGKTVLQFGLAYGLRNITNITRKLKMGRSQLKLDFIEIMACPSGCVNGGGQIRPQKGEDPKEHLKRVEQAYDEQVVKLPEENEEANGMYKEWFDGVFTTEAKTKLHTQYHAREKMVTNALNIKW